LALCNEAVYILLEFLKYGHSLVHSSHILHCSAIASADQSPLPRL